MNLHLHLEAGGAIPIETRINEGGVQPIPGAPTAATARKKIEAFAGIRFFPPEHLSISPFLLEKGRTGQLPNIVTT